MSCQNQLSWYELIPLLSFLALAGRCKSCKTKISAQYPLVEFITGLVFAGLFLKFQDVFLGHALVFSITYSFYAVIFSLLIVIGAYDLKHKIIPDTLSLLGGVLALTGMFFFVNFSNSSTPFFYPHLPSILEFLSGPIIALPFALLWLISRGRWMGLGDAKLALPLGWLLGLAGAFSAVVLAFWIGAIIGVVLILASRNYKMKSEIPFAPYLILGTLLAFFFNLHFPI